jgi:hypothetical protein
MDGLLDRTFGERPDASRLVNVRKLNIPGIMRATESYGAFCGQITTTKVSLMSIKFEGEPPFYLGVAETAAAQVLDTNVIVRVAVSTSQTRPKFVPVRFTIAPEVAKSLAEQLVVAAKLAESHRQRGY